MWKITAWDIINHFRRGEGKSFTDFIDSLIRTTAYLQKVPQSEIKTNLRTNLGDRGVDTEVCQAIGDRDTGWMDVPTSWQYKATDLTKAQPAHLKTEINKPYSIELIQKNYGYRYCLCDDLSLDKRSEKERILNEEIKKINPSAPPAKILTASDLAVWASQFPGIITQYFRPELEPMLHLQAWGKNITKLTPKYVDVSIWDTVTESLLKHIDYDWSCDDNILTIQGEAGVGKTRLVYETLSSLAGLESLVLYTTEETKAVDIAYRLANDESARAILVADECTIQKRSLLQNILEGHTDRIRIICIDNSEKLSGETWLQEIPKQDVKEILKKNYLKVSEFNRSVYAELSDGFIRLAAYLCTQDPLENSNQSLGSLNDILGYLKSRLNDEEFTIIAAISLVRKVGYRDTVKKELEQLCELCSNLSQEQVIQTVQRLKDAPGFVNIAGRYLYITPEIVAHLAFAEAWKRWAELDPSGFLSRIPNSLLESFLNRCSRSASPEVCRIVGDFFRNWGNQLKPIDLADLNQVEQFTILAKIDPENYLPILKRLIENSSQEDLLKVDDGYRGTKSSLIRLVGKLAIIPEVFYQSEWILWKFALIEIEHNLGNSAIGSWQHLFRIFLSGTSMPFLERLDLLEKRLLTDNEWQIDLSLQCLSGTFQTQGKRIVGSPIVAGRVLPKDWQPQTNLELKQCLDRSLDLLSKAVNSDITKLREEALKVAIANLSQLLRYGYLEQMRAIFEQKILPEDILISLVNKLDKTARFNSEENLEVRAWLETLIPDSFHGKLVEIIGGRSPFWYSSDEKRESYDREIEKIAIEFCNDLEILKKEIDWLCSPMASNALFLGIKMGECDRDAVCLDIILDAVKRTHETGLAAPYIGRLVTEYPKHQERVNAWLDRFTSENPKIAFELFSAGGDNTRALARTIELVDEGNLAIDYFGKFRYGISQRELSENELLQILSRLLKEMKAEKYHPSASIAVETIYNSLEVALKSPNQQIYSNPDLQNTIWEILELSLNHNWIREWEQTVGILADFDNERAIELAHLALVHQENNQSREAANILIKLIQEYPDRVMQELEKIILSEKHKWDFGEAPEHKRIIQSLPFETISKWLEKVGTEGARVIVKTLSLPYLNEDSQPIIPNLTEFVLSTFGNDRETFERFCYSSHNNQVYLGDMDYQKRQEAEVARHFLNHPLKPIRDWAIYEMQSCEQDAQRWKQIWEEHKIP